MQQKRDYEDEIWDAGKEGVWGPGKRGEQEKK
jgi:hypothetical protein